MKFLLHLFSLPSHLILLLRLALVTLVTTHYNALVYNSTERPVHQETPFTVIKMAALSKPTKSSVGLGNRVLLDKMDKLRGLGISNLVSLPQVSSLCAP